MFKIREKILTCPIRPRKYVPEDRHTAIRVEECRFPDLSKLTVFVWPMGIQLTDFSYIPSLLVLLLEGCRLNWKMHGVWWIREYWRQQINTLQWRFLTRTSSTELDVIIGKITLKIIYVQRWDVRTAILFIRTLFNVSF